MLVFELRWLRAGALIMSAFTSMHCTVVPVEESCITCPALGEIEKGGAWAIADANSTVVHEWIEHDVGAAQGKLAQGVDDGCGHVGKALAATWVATFVQ